MEEVKSVQMIKVEHVVPLVSVTKPA